jgi:monoterpene epsilon-lactone hydrolase
MVSPYRSPEILRKFPPTLVITSTRAFDLSTAVNTHRELVKAGVDAELHAWDGFIHGWFYNLDIPESREVFDVMAHFFGKHLGLEIKK